MNITRQGLLVAIAVSLGLFPAVHASAQPKDEFVLKFVKP